MLRVKGKATLRRKFLALYCLLALVLPGCGPRRTGSANFAVPVVKGAPGKVKTHYGAVKEKDFSRNIRAVFRASADNYQVERALRPTTAEDVSEGPDIQAAAKEVEENPGDAQAARRLADLYFAAERYFEAFQIYRRLDADSPERAVSRALAAIWDRWGNYPQALEHAVRAVASPEISAEDWLFLGRIHLHGGNWTAGVAALRKSTQMDPFDAAPWRELGEAFSGKRDWSLASVFLQRAVDLDPARNEVRRRLAEALAHSGNQRMALREFMAVESAAEAYNDLGEIQRAEGRWQAAHEAFSGALIADPSSSRARANLEKTLPYLPIPSSVTLPSFDLLSEPVRLVNLPPLPEFPEIQPLPGFDSLPPARNAGLKESPPAPLVIEVAEALTNRVFASGAPSAPVLQGEPRAADLGSAIVVGGVQEVIQLPGAPVRQSVPENTIDFEPTPTAPWEFSEPPILPTSPQPAGEGIPSLPLAGIVNLPSWDSAPDSAPAAAPLQGPLPPGTTFAELGEPWLTAAPITEPTSRPSSALAPKEVEPLRISHRGPGPARVFQVSLADLRPLDVVDLQASERSAPAQINLPIVVWEGSSGRVSELIKVEELRQTLAVEPAPSLRLRSSLRLLDSPAIQALGPAPRPNAPRLAPPDLSDMLQTMVDNMLDLPDLGSRPLRIPDHPGRRLGMPGSGSPYLLGSPARRISGSLLVRISQPQPPPVRDPLTGSPLANPRDARISAQVESPPPGDSTRVAPVMGATARRKAGKEPTSILSVVGNPEESVTVPATRELPAASAIDRPVWSGPRSYPIPFVSRDASRFAGWRADSGELPVSYAKAGNPRLAVAIVTALSVGLLGAALVFVAGFGILAALLTGAVWGGLAGCWVGTATARPSPSRPAASRPA